MAIPAAREPGPLGDLGDLGAQPHSGKCRVDRIRCAQVTALRYHALFVEAGGLSAGDDVKVSGVKVVAVKGISLRRGKAQVDFTLNSAVTLGSETTTHIRTGTLLGKRILTLESAGNVVMRPLSVIPAARTASSYSLTEAVGDLAADTAGTNLGSLNQSLDTLAGTINQIAPQLGPTFDGLTRLSKSINSRNDTGAELLTNTGAVTGILAERSQQVNQLILDANDLLEVLVQRRKTIVAHRTVVVCSADASWLDEVPRWQHRNRTADLQLLRGPVQRIVFAGLGQHGRAERRLWSE